MTSKPSLLAALLTAALLAAGCQPPSAERAALALTDCRPAGFAEQVRCGALELAEDPAAPEGRRIALRIAVLPARAAHPEPDPLYVIAGGPGQSALGAAPMLSGFLGQVRKRRDVVLVDQRGTGKSNPLTCEDVRERLPIAARLVRDDLADGRALADCLKSLQARADLRFYGTSQAVDDLEAVRAALGHARINLWGISYGTRVALAYLGRHEARVRSLTLDAVVPPDVSLPKTMGDSAARALDLAFADCARDAACAAAFPDLPARFRALLERLRQSPLAARAPDPRTGQMEEVAITAETFTSIARNLLYDPDVAALLPLTISQLERGDPRGFLAQAAALTKSVGVSEGMHLSVFCNEDFGRARRAQEIEVARTPDRALGDLFGRQVAESYGRSCANWPRAEVPAALFEPVTSAVPALILSGALDPVTPPAFGERVRQSLSNARHVVAPGAAHGLTARGCTAKVIARFIDEPAPAALDVACIEAMRRPDFFLDFAGPKP